jgi:hypothetical protein
MKIKASVLIAVFLFLCAAVALISGLAPTLKFLALPPPQKFYSAWEKDLDLLGNTKTLPSQWNDIGEIQVETNNSVVEAWLNKSPPIKKNPKGTVKLKILVVHWIQDYRYGVMIQYTLVDAKSDNMLTQFGRTLKLGYVY